MLSSVFLSAILAIAAIKRKSAQYKAKIPTES